MVPQPPEPKYPSLAMTHPVKPSTKSLWPLVTAMLVLLSATATAQTTLVGITNHTWKYHATTGSDPGAGWQNPGFDDSAWPSGRGLFGIDSGYPFPFATSFPGPSAGGPVVAFFRTTFNWSGSPIGQVFTMTNYFDDGVVLYLNGVELTRFNMPAGPADQNTLAIATITEPVVRLHQVALDFLTNGNPNPLLNGQNVLAASVHNNTPTSSDTVFGLALNAGHIDPCFFDPLQPTNRFVLQGRSTTFTISVGCLPAPTVQWYRDTGSGEEPVLGATAMSYTLTNAGFTDIGVYYAKATNPGGTVESRHALLTLIADATAPKLVAGRLGVNNRQIIVQADETLCLDWVSCGVQPPQGWDWEVFPVDDPLNPLPIDFIEINGATLTFTLDGSTPWQFDTPYVVRLNPAGLGQLADPFGNTLNPGDPGSSVTLAAVPSAISVKPVVGSDLYTFDTPPGAWEFSTFNWVGESNGTQETAETVNAAVQMLDVSLIASPLAGASGLPPGATGGANYAIDGRYLATRPAGTRGNVVLARLRNDTGAARFCIQLQYTLGIYAPTFEEVPGHIVYYSFSGASNTWIRIPALSGDGVAGAKTALLDLGFSPWSAGAMLYVLFADDNGSGSPDTGLSIDNFKVSNPFCDPWPSITAQPVSVYTNEGAVVRFSIVAQGMPPLAYQWFKDGIPFVDGGTISGAATAQLTINGVAACSNASHVGSYYCRVTNSVQSVTSTVATLTIALDLVRPVLTRALGPNPTTVLLAFSKNMGTNAGDPARYAFTDGITVSAASVSSNTVTLTTSPRPVGIASLRLTGITDNRGCPSVISPNPTFVQLTTVQVIDPWNSAWRYHTNNLDTAPDWHTTGGAGWRNGNGIFGTETTAATLALLPAPIATVIPPPNTNNQFLTSYFRKTVILPALAAGQTYALGYYADDGAVFYLDGVEIGRFNMPTGAVTFLTFATASLPEGVARVLPFTAAAGTHILAAEIHQNANVSSDTLFGAQVIVLPTEAPSLSIRPDGTNALLTWIADSSLKLHSSTNLTGPYDAVAGNPFRRHAAPTAASSGRFFRLNYVPQPGGQ
jgi:Immunoglobulin domain